MIALINVGRLRFSLTYVDSMVFHELDTVWPRKEAMLVNLSA